MTRCLPGRKSYVKARAELEKTRAELERVQRQWPIVHHITDVFREHRERNHFSESIARIYRGGDQ